MSVKLKTSIYTAVAGMSLLALASCSSSDDVQPEVPSQNVKTSYLAVSLQGVGSVPSMNAKAMSRAYNDSSSYVYGESTTEGKVSRVRFYLFDVNGNAYPLANHSGLNWVEASYADDDVNQTATFDRSIESRTKAVLVIDGVTGTLPARIAAIVNPGGLSEGVLGDGSLSEDALKASTLTTKSYNSADGFVMSSAVYNNASNANVTSTTINASNFKSTADSATMDPNPVQLYVERVVARVDVAHTEATPSGWGSALINGTNHDIYHLGNYSYIVPGQTTPSDVDVYAVIEGWGLADENDNAAIQKSLSTSYANLAPSDALANEPWNAADYHRSFWENSSAYNRVERTYNEYVNGGLSLGGSTYTFPNTPTSSFTWDEVNRRTSAETNPTIESPTKVVIAARLMYSTLEGGVTTWHDAEICKYRGQDFLGEVNVKTAIANDVVQSTDNNIYIGPSSASAYNASTFKSLDPSHITFSTRGDAGSRDSYRLTAGLTDLPSDSAYYLRSGDNVTRYSSKSSAENALHDVASGEITVSKGGRTYYYTTLRHLWFPTSSFDTAENIAANESTLPGTNNIGAWGVVRNHLYKVTLNSIAGWGTPVYNPDQIIIPVTPLDDQSYLAAQINVLQWRVVDQTVDIDGNTSRQ